MTREERQKQLDEEFLKNYDPNSIGGDEHYSYLKGTWCNFCKHYFGNDRCACKAFPNGIPDKFALVKWGDKPIKHTEIDEAQVGSFVFKSIKPD